MNIQAEKIALLKLLLDTNNPEIIQSIKQVFEKEKSISIQEELTSEQKAEIEEALIEIENGNVVDYETIMAKHR
jgi:predicted transcriptional regulator